MYGKRRGTLAVSVSHVISSVSKMISSQKEPLVSLLGEQQCEQGVHATIFKTASLIRNMETPKRYFADMSSFGFRMVVSLSGKLSFRSFSWRWHKSAS